jgi:hypothetical protein
VNGVNPSLAVDLSALASKAEPQVEEAEQEQTLQPLEDITVQATVMALVTLLGAEYGNKFISNLMMLVQEFEAALERGAAEVE